MKKNRRDFVKITGLAGMGLAGTGILNACTAERSGNKKINKVIVDHVITKLEDGTEVPTPFWCVSSGKDGPSLALIASQHGNEVQGAEVARRFQEICSEQLVSGSVWLFPMANILAVRSRRHSFNLEPEQNNRLNPEKLHNMQRHWPGNPEGNYTARLAYALDQKVLRHCSHLVDMHCWEHHVAAETLSENKHKGSYAMGQAATARFISYRDTVIPETDTMMISQMILKRGGSVLVMELSGQFQMQERQVQIGLSSMVNIAKDLGMIKGNPVQIFDRRVVRNNETSHEIKIPCTGIFMTALHKDKSSKLMPDDFVEEGQLLGHIIRETNLETVQIFSPVSGYLWRYGLCHWSLCDASLPAQHPYAEEGEIIAVVVTV